LIYNRADLVVAVSEEIKLQLIGKYNIPKEKLKVIYNGLDIEKIIKLSKEDVEEKYRGIFNYPCIISSGRLTHQKGQWHLLKAFKKVKESVKDAKLVILGEGELEGRLKTLAQDLGIKDEVYFFGFKKNPHKYISRAHVFVLPSLYEGFPNSLIEAMAVNTPVITTCCRTGPMEIVDPIAPVGKKVHGIEFADYGVIIPELSGNEGFAEDELEQEECMLSLAIVKMLSDSPLRESYRAKSAERSAHFDISEIIKSWIEVI
jgi:glycosyltransferase involved in cell wall biosynthesis